MNLNDIVLNYLTDNEKGMQQLITWFLNDVMNEEVAQQAGVPLSRDRVRGGHTGTDAGPNRSRPYLKN